MVKSSISISMFGEFNIEYEGQSIAVDKNSSTKISQLFQILIYERNGIQRLDLMEYLFSDEKITNPANSLRAIVFRLRKGLENSILPDDEYVHISKGMYSFSNKFRVSCDVHDFEDLEVQLDSITNVEDRCKIFERIFELYKGDFLPMISTCWSLSKAVVLREKYLKCMREYCEYIFAKEEYDKLLKISHRISEMYPYECFQTYEMKAMIKLSMHTQAMRLYEKTEQLMYDELGVSAPQDMTAMLKELGENYTNSSNRIDQVKKTLNEIKTDEDGAFFCSFPSFSENYRYVRRVIRRNRQSAWLMLCTITDGNGVPLKTNERLELLAKDLFNVINNTIRGGDMFTRYSDNQFLLLLLGTTKEDCDVVQKRIFDGFEKDSRKKYFKFQLAPVNENSIGTSENNEELSDIVRGLE